MRRAIAIGSVVVLAGLAACGNDDGGGGGAGGLSASAAQERVDAAVLTVEDLGEGWVVDESDDEDDEISDEEFAECVGDEAATLFEEDDESELATEVEVMFVRELPDELVFQTIQQSSGALEDEAIYDTIVEVLSDEQTGDCITGLIADYAVETDQVEAEFGGWSARTDVVDGADTSMFAGADFSFTVQGIDLEGRLDLALVTSGQVGSIILAMGIGDPITDVQLEEWSELLLERQAG